MKKISSISAVLLLSACGTIFSGTTQNVTINVRGERVKNAPPAYLNIANNQFNIEAGNTFSVNLPKSCSPKTIMIEDDRNYYRVTNSQINTTFNPVTILNVFFWPGFVIDAVTGAMCRYDDYASIYLNPRK